MDEERRDSVDLTVLDLSSEEEDEYDDYVHRYYMSDLTENGPRWGLMKQNAEVVYDVEGRPTLEFVYQSQSNGSENAR